MRCYDHSIEPGPSIALVPTRSDLWRPLDRDAELVQLRLGFSLQLELGLRLRLARDEGMREGWDWGTGMTIRILRTRYIYYLTE